MENQTQNPTIPTVAPQAVSPAPAGMPAPESQPVQSMPSSTPPSTGSSKKLLMILAVVVLLLAFGAYYYFAAGSNNSNLSATPTVMPQNTAVTITPTPTTVITPIQNSSDLNGALNQIDTATPSASTDLNQNAADSTTFTQ